MNILQEAGLKIGKIITIVDREEGGKELLSKKGIKIESLVRIGQLRK